jgi:hypothetical protein
MKPKSLSKIALTSMFFTSILVGGAFAGCSNWEDDMEHAPALEICLDGACINVLQWYDCGNMSAHSAGFTEIESGGRGVMLSVYCEVESEGSGYDGMSRPTDCTVNLGGIPLSQRIKEQYLTCRYLNREDGPSQCHWFE